MDWKIQLANYGIEIIGGIALTILSVLARYAITYFNTRAAACKIQITASQQQILAGILDHAVAYSEEYWKKQAMDRIIPGTNPKMDTAVTFALGMMEKQNLPAMADDALKQWIEARLNMARDPTAPNVPTVKK